MSGPMGNRPDEAAMLQKEREAITLKAAGATYAEIGRLLNMDRSNVAKMVKRALLREHSDAVDEYRRVEGERLDRLQRAVWGQAMGGDTDAVKTIIRVMQRRARLFGLDAPVRHTITTEMDAQIEALLEEMRTLPPAAFDAPTEGQEVDAGVGGEVGGDGA